MVIYKTGNIGDSAIIPLKISYYKVNDDWAKKIINNDMQVYKSNISANASLQETIDSAFKYMEFKETTTSESFPIKNETLNSSLLERDLNLYYIENFTYVLDDDKYTDSNTLLDVSKNKDDYMFTIQFNIPEIEMKEE